MEPTRRRKTSPRHCEQSDVSAVAQRAKAEAIHLWRRETESWIASSQELLAMTWRGHGFNFQITYHSQPQLRVLAAHRARVLLLIPALSIQRAQGMPGARCAR